MRVLYVGTLEWGSTSLQRMEAMRCHVGHIYSVDFRIFHQEYPLRGAWERWRIRVGSRRLVREVSEEIVREADRYRPDLVWIDQGVCVSAEAVRQMRDSTGSLCAHYTPDSLQIFLRHRNHCFCKALKEYDVCVTTKGHEMDLYRAHGARYVLLSYKGYDPRIHRPVALTHDDLAKYACDVAFVGDRGPERADLLAALVGSVPCKLNLYGRNWDRGSTGTVLGPLHRGWVSGDGYAKALCAAKICLVFLNRRAGDTYTQRSIEVPACGTFMLAERTETHRELFAEDREAVFFDGPQELIDKVRFYLAHDEARQRIAAAGHHRVMQAGFSWESRMGDCVAACRQLRDGEPLQDRRPV